MPNLPLSALCAGGLIAAAYAGRKAVAELEAGGAPHAWLSICTAFQFGATALLWSLAADIGDRTGHAFHATSFVIIAYAALHAALGILFALYGLSRLKAGYLSAARSLDLRIGRLWHDYTAVAGIVALAAVAVLALLAGGEAGR